MSTIQKKCFFAFIAGAIAITLNTVLLELADLIPLQTAHGGLLKLILLSVSTVQKFVSPSSATLGSYTVFASSAFKTGFHIVVGLLMAQFYAFIVAPLLGSSAFKNGVVYAIGAWLANALIVLPQIGEGVAGSHYLTGAGIAYYAAAHTVFFVVQALLYDRLLKTSHA